MSLIESILAGGAEALSEEYRMAWFPGDDLLAACRPRGLPIGNLTSQFWSNCYLHAFDLCVKRELGCKAYLRYVDDFAVFGDSKAQLWCWKQRIATRLATLRLAIHDESAQAQPTAAGIAWLGFVVYPGYRKVKARRVNWGTRRLRGRYAAYRGGQLCFAPFDASVQGWINHVRFADSWGLRRHVLALWRLKPGDMPRSKTGDRVN
jgi:RNA-directed DNA polymerase